VDRRSLDTSGQKLPMKVERHGSRIARRRLKKCVLEMGGSDPFIVLDAAGDGGLQHILGAAAGARLGNTGQSCVAANV
jgi:succinate-semialdehyde dehydrogenase/glutarate-semialdehyde dehydrogenase